MHCIAECRVVNSVRRAAETLLQSWSIDDGEEFPRQSCAWRVLRASRRCSRSIHQTRS
ncbi:DUF982 domain-containing protein [Rhizobium sp. CC1099]|uniref:DUF982 domain-containing protein n=1 Tax=Rhizobium sp. CC1099 TaxID=3039160 RepID=UPI0032C246AF